MATIRDLSLRNFKSFRTAHVPLGKGFVTIVGPNGSGKSVREDTEILLSNGEFRTIGDLVNSALEKSAEIVRFDDGVASRQNPENVRVLGLDVETMRIVEKDIDAFLKRDGEEKLYKIVTRSGRSIVSTGCHPVMIFKDGKVVSEVVVNLRVGQTIATPNKLPFDDAKAGQIKLPIPKGFAFVDSADGDRWIIEEDAGKGRAAKKTITIPKTVDCDFARFIGYLIGDGYITKGRCEFVNVDEANLSDFVSLAEKYVQSSESYYRKKVGKATRIILRSGRLSEYLAHLFRTGDVHKLTSQYKSIPPEIIVSSDATVSNLLAALFDCDGYVSKTAPQFEFSTKNERLANQVQMLLLRFGIVSFKKSKLKYVANTKNKTKRLYHSLCIYGIKNLRKLYENIPLRCAMKKRRLAEQANRKIKPNQNIELLPQEVNKYVIECAQALGIAHKPLRMRYPHFAAYMENRRAPSEDGIKQILEEIFRPRLEELLTLVNELPKEKKAILLCMKNLRIRYPEAAKAIGLRPSTIGQWAMNRCDPLPENLEKWYNFVKHHLEERHASAAKLIGLLETFIASDIFWDPIVKIEEVRGERWVYDLSIPNCHNFIGNGIFVHNSNLMDALRFAFGENHLRALRVRRVQDLIYQGSDKAYIRLNIDGVGTNGDSQAEIIRAIRADGKTLYRLNGKRTTRTVVVDYLKANGLDIGEHNVIAQGEVEKIARLNSKERREIVDRVAGISEFEEKRREALTELGKVEQKLNDASIVMKEREGVLAELEKEKDAALKYISLKDEQRRIKGTLVITQYRKAENEFTGLVNKCVEGRKKIADAENEMMKLVENSADLNRKRNEINAKIASMDTRNVYAELAQLRGKIELDENVLREKTAALNRLESEVNGLGAEEKKIEGKLSEFGGAKRSSAARAAELKARLEQLVAERDKSAKEWEEKRRKLGIFDKQLDDKRKEADKLREEITRLKTKLEMSSPAGGEGGRRELEAELQSIDAEIESLKRSRTRLFEREKELNERVKTLDVEILKLGEEVAANRGSARSVIPQAITFISGLKEKGEVSGVYGTVGELFTVDKKYEVAAETAAGQRLNYIVVADLAKATEMVKLLKERNMGRATFIPLNVRVPQQREDAGKAAKGGKGIIGRLIDLIGFDSKFGSVFQYVFGETLLVEDVDTFKSTGTRAVTLDGDLYETSGIVTGGTAIKRSMREHVNLPKLERELDGKRKERERTIQELYSVNEEITMSRRCIAEKEVRKKEIEIELGAIDGGVKIDDVRKELVEKEADLEEVERETLNIQGEKSRIRIAIENSEDEKERVRFDSEIMELRTELSAIEAKLKGEEGIILQERLNVVKTTKAQLTAEMKAITEEVREIEKRLKQNRKSLEAKEEKIKDESKTLEKLYAEVKQIQEQLDAINVERGRIERRIERTKEDLIRSETLKEEMEKRLADLKYEADFYKDITIIDAKREELEHRAVQIEAELQSIGTVNMKAPEMYEEKAKDYDAIKEKVAVLSGERASVLKMIEEVELRKKDVFMKTFKEVNEHFKKLAGSIFQNEVTLRLENEVNPFDGGLHIVMTIGKKERNIELMSGGEKSLLTIMFVFALHMCRPSQFYILDEVEAALDKENSLKFSELIKQISKTTQFIVVSHNDTVITSADTAIGVAKTKHGSKIVSIKLT